VVGIHSKEYFALVITQGNHNINSAILSAQSSVIINWYYHHLLAYGITTMVASTATNIQIVFGISSY